MVDVLGEQGLDPGVILVKGHILVEENAVALAKISVEEASELINDVHYSTKDERGSETRDDGLV